MEKNDYFSPLHRPISRYRLDRCNRTACSTDIPCGIRSRGGTTRDNIISAGAGLKWRVKETVRGRSCVFWTIWRVSWGSCHRGTLSQVLRPRPPSSLLSGSRLALPPFNLHATTVSLPSAATSMVACLAIRDCGTPPSRAYTITRSHTRDSVQIPASA